MIRFDNVSHRYGERVVLDDITVQLDEPRIGIVGANGSGKSTLARMINGLIQPTSGQISVDGLDPARQGAEVRRRVGFVFTDPDAQIVMPTVAEDVAFSLRRHKLSRSEVSARVEATLARFGLAAHRDSPCHLLSGGQKQLLAFAAVLVTDPAVLVCDEPTTLLDLRNARAISALIESLDQQVVMVTHHLALLDRFDRVIVIDDHRIVSDDVPAVAIAEYVRRMEAS